MRKLTASLLAFAMLSAALPAGAAGISLHDLSGHWARPQVEAAIAAGYVSGFPDGSFRPNQPVTRGEFFKMLSAAMRLAPSHMGTGFAEDQAATPAWSFAKGYIPAAVGSGLIKPPDYNFMFGPDTPISRREIVMAAVRALGQDSLAMQGDHPLNAPDAGAYEDWLKRFAAVAVDNGIITGMPDGTLALHRTATRAEALVMIQRILAKLTLQLAPADAPAGENAVRHPGEGEPTWSWTEAAPGRPVITNGTADQDYTFQTAVTGLALVPVPGKATWVRYQDGADGVVARLRQGVLAEAARYPGRTPVLLTADDEGKLFYTDGAGQLLTADRNGAVQTVAGVTEPVTFGGTDWSGGFWGLSARHVYQVANDATLAAFDLDPALQTGAQPMAVNDDGDLWELTAPAAGNGKVEAVQVAQGKAARRVTLLGAFFGGPATDARLVPVGRTGPFLWLSARVAAPGASEQEAGLYRFSLDTGAFARMVAPAAVSDGYTVVAAPDGGALLKDATGLFWRILP